MTSEEERPETNNQKFDFDRRKSQKREDYLSWNDYFMATAFLAAKRSKDPVTQVGACIVNSDNKIVGVGYNGFPKGCSDDVFPWGKDSLSPLDNKKYYVCHAEANAILNINSSGAKGCKMYVTLFPCNECAKLIIQSGIKEIIYMNADMKNKYIASKKMLDAAKVNYSQFIPDSNAPIKINLNVNNGNTESAESKSSPPKRICTGK